MGETAVPTPDVTRLLEAWTAGRQEALAQLLPAVYGELRRMARGQLARARRHHTFQPTDLVHEAFVRLVDQRAPWQNRVHFFGIASTCMRRVLADYARRRKAAKRPQVDKGVEVDRIDRTSDPAIERLLAIDETLERLARTDARQARVAELKMFASMEDGDIATLLGVSEATAKRDWKKARPLFIDILKEWPRDAR
jgi:RNA polymerase sigma factor (TIGR02999 family)